MDDMDDLDDMREKGCVFYGKDVGQVIQAVTFMGW